MKEQARHRNPHEEADVAGCAEAPHAEQASMQTIEQGERRWKKGRTADAEKKHRLDQRGQIICGERKQEKPRGEGDRADRTDSKVTESITHPSRGNRAESHHQQNGPDQTTANRGVETDRFGEEEAQRPGQETTCSPIGGGHEQERPQRRTSGDGLGLGLGLGFGMR